LRGESENWAGVPNEQGGPLICLNPLILSPEYAEDGIITNHIVYFLKSPKFISAYEGGQGN